MNNPASLPWLPILRDAVDVEYGDRPRIVTLATVDANHHPRARTVILRRLDDAGALWITSSAHAQKNAHLRQTPFAEIVVYLPASRQQFRLAGFARVICAGVDEPLRQRFWLNLSDAARATFFWPTIGELAIAGDSPPAAVPASIPMPDIFELIALHPDQVERLTTSTLPHRRTRWRQQSGWNAEALNP